MHPLFKQWLISICFICFFNLLTFKSFVRHSHIHYWWVICISQHRWAKMCFSVSLKTPRSSTSKHQQADKLIRDPCHHLCDVRHPQMRAVCVIGYKKAAAAFRLLSLYWRRLFVGLYRERNEKYHCCECTVLLKSNRVVEHPVSKPLGMTYSLSKARQPTVLQK